MRFMRVDTYVFRRLQLYNLIHEFELPDIYFTIILHPSIFTHNILYIWTKSTLLVFAAKTRVSGRGGPPSSPPTSSKYLPITTISPSSSNPPRRESSQTFSIRKQAPSLFTISNSWSLANSLLVSKKFRFINLFPTKHSCFFPIPSK